MSLNRYSSPIYSLDLDDDALDEDADSITESDSDWSGPQNQLGLGSDHLSGRQQDDEDQVVVALNKKGEFKYHEAIVKY